MKEKNKLLSNKMSSPRNVFGDLPLTWPYKKGIFSLFQTTKSAENSRQRHSGMTTLFDCRAFTLIELLVVVLIIGILAAIAVPQYEKTVEKAKAVQALTLLKSTISAVDRYYLANGEYPTSFSQLDIQMPWTGTYKPYHTLADWKSGEEWSIGLFNTSADGVVIALYRISGNYNGAAFVYAFKRTKNDYPTGEILCREASTMTEGAYCQKLFAGNKVDTLLGESRLYRISL